jgi:type II secretory pathway predicted ATPase ExeA
MRRRRRSSAIRASRYPDDAHHAESELRKSVGIGGAGDAEWERDSELISDCAAAIDDNEGVRDVAGGSGSEGTSSVERSA